MPGSSPEARLIVGGQAWANWTRYELEADYETPTDSWSVEVRNPTRAHLETLLLGSAVVLLVDDVPALRGWLEGKEIHRDRAGGLVVTLTGRDLAAPLVDCSPPPLWSLPNMPLAAVAQQALAELGIAATVVPEPEALVPRPLHKAEPGETYWQVIERYCHKLRLLPWMSPLGVLHLGRPDYITPPVATLMHGATLATQGLTNVLEATYSSSLTGRFSQVTVVGQAAGGGSLFASPSMGQVTGVATDPTLLALGLNRPTVVDDGEANTVAEAIDRARWEISQRTYQGEVLHYTVPGHGPVRKVLWSPNQNVVVNDEVAGVTGPWWVSKRRFVRDRSQGTRTTLELHPAGTLLPPV